jgi:hypothetical protein
MNAIDIEKLNQLISRTDISGNDKVKWLEDFISGRELQQQETLYSEEEVENILIEYVKTNPTKPYRVLSWFREFKKNNIKKETIQTSEISIVELWQPTLQLRFLEKAVAIDENTGAMKMILQQLHTSNLGNQEWRDVPSETI